MAEWVTLFITNLLCPVFLIVYGSIYVKKTPKNINGSNGYKTARSRLSQETWEFVNHYAARISRMVGWTLLILSVAAMALLRGKDDGTVSFLGVGILFAQVIILVFAVVPPTEAALKKNFDDTGKRK